MQICNELQSLCTYLHRLRGKVGLQAASGLATAVRTVGIAFALYRGRGRSYGLRSETTSAPVARYPLATHQATSTETEC